MAVAPVQRSSGTGNSSASCSRSSIVALCRIALVLLLPTLASSFLSSSVALTPRIVALHTDDPDDGDRGYGVGDELAIYLVPYITSQDPAVAYFVGSRPRNVLHPSAVMNRSVVDSLFAFSVSLGADYIGTWEASGSLVEILYIRIIDPSGADVAALEAFNFTVSCVAGAVVMSDHGTDPADGACDSFGASAVEPQASDRSWGRGRPFITAVNSSSASNDRLLASGDTITVSFDAAVDRSASAYVSAYGGLAPSELTAALFTLPASVAAVDHDGVWLDNRTFRITFTATPAASAAATLPAGDDYTLSCVADAELRLALGGAPSAMCCESDDGGCLAVGATGSFGILPDGTRHEAPSPARTLPLSPSPSLALSHPRRPCDRLRARRRPLGPRPDPEHAPRQRHRRACLLITRAPPPPRARPIPRPELAQSPTRSRPISRTRSPASSRPISSDLPPRPP